MPAGSACLLEQIGHLTISHVHVEFPAWLATLADLDHCAAQLQNVSDAQRIFYHADRRDFLTKCPWQRIGRQGCFADPACIMIKRVVMDGLVDAAMNREVGLRILYKTA